MVMTFNIGEKAKQKGSMTMKVLLQREGRMHGEQKSVAIPNAHKSAPEISNPSLEIHMHACILHAQIYGSFFPQQVRYLNIDLNYPTTTYYYYLTTLI